MLTSVNRRQSTTVRRGRAVEKRTRRASDRPPGGVARAEVSVVNGSRMLAPMLSAFHFLTHVALGVQNRLVMGLTLLGALAIGWRR
jgi:hypothetical protein